MNRAATCWGVYRELAHSPGRETDDAEILRATAAELERLGLTVALKSPDELPDVDAFGGVPPHLFVMCERVEVVDKLAAWEARGVRVVNRPSGIRNTDRERTLALFRAGGVPYPRTRPVETAATTPFEGPCWVKRGDVHATAEGDVAYCGDAGTLAGNLARLASRGIPRAIVQEHVAGDLVKFYGVAGIDEGEWPSWFQWFYHRDQRLSNHPFELETLKAATARAAAALGLEVYGGDAIVSEDGRVTVIDLNAWPSFALFRPVAAARIATLLAARFSSTGVTR